MSRPIDPLDIEHLSIAALGRLMQAEAADLARLVDLETSTAEALYDAIDDTMVNLVRAQAVLVAKSYRNNGAIQPSVTETRLILDADDAATILANVAAA